MFCGECGRSVALTRQNIAPAAAQALRSDPTALPEAPPVAAAHDAAPDVPAPVDADHNDGGAEFDADADADADAESDEHAGDDDASVEPDDDVVAEEAPELHEPGPLEPTPVEAPATQPVAHRPSAHPDELIAPTPTSTFAPAQRPATAPPPPDRFSSDIDHVDVEPTRLSKPALSGDRFILQFSTGESVTVFGTGLVGRNPNPEPGEYFDHRVLILDPTRSVSKTHLEFGQTAGEFWINDRFSGNGSGIRPPDAPRVPCSPGKRYMVARGSRVDIGEQFFIVS